jgi:LysM repeat protein
VSGGVEVRASLAFSYRVEEETPQTSVTLVRLSEDSPWNSQGQPSLVLRRVEPGEGLWELAKRFHTRGADILEANGLEGEPLETGVFLLIPKTR